MTCFGKTVDWDSFTNMVSKNSQIRIDGLARQENLSHAYFYKLMDYADMAGRIKLNQWTGRDVLWRSQFYYYTIRVLKSPERNTIEKLAKEFVELGIGKYHDCYKIALQNYLYRNRAEEKSHE